MPDSREQSHRSISTAVGDGLMRGQLPDHSILSPTARCLRSETSTLLFPGGSLVSTAIRLECKHSTPVATTPDLVGVWTATRGVDPFCPARLHSPLPCCCLNFTCGHTEPRYAAPTPWSGREPTSPEACRHGARHDTRNTISARAPNRLLFRNARRRPRSRHEFKALRDNF